MQGQNEGAKKRRKFDALLRAVSTFPHSQWVCEQSCGAVYYAVQDGFNFKVCEWNPIQIKATEQYFPVVLFIMLCKMVLTFKSVNEILKCDHSNKSYWAVRSRGAVYFAVHIGSNFLLCIWNPKVWPFKWKPLSSTLLWCCFNNILYKLFSARYLF